MKKALLCFLSFSVMMFAACGSKESDLPNQPQTSISVSREVNEVTSTTTEITDYTADNTVEADITPENNYASSLIGYWCEFDTYDPRQLGKVMHITSAADDDTVTILLEDAWSIFFDGDALVTDSTITAQTFNGGILSGLTNWIYSFQDDFLVLDFCAYYRPITEDEFNIYKESYGHYLSWPEHKKIEDTSAYLIDDWDIPTELLSTTDNIYKLKKVDSSALTITASYHNGSLNMATYGLCQDEIYSYYPYTYNGVTEKNSPIELYKKMFELIGPPNKITGLDSEPYSFEDYISDVDAYLDVLSKEYVFDWNFDNGCELSLIIDLSNQIGASSFWITNNITMYAVH